MRKSSDIQSHLIIFIKKLGALEKLVSDFTHLFGCVLYVNFTRAKELILLGKKYSFFFKLR